MKLYSFWRSTTSVRTRIVLNLKGIDYDMELVSLPKGEQFSDAYAAVNPARGVPSLVLDDGTVLTQSLAIIEYLDTVHPSPRVIPEEPVARAKVQAAAHCVALDIHPVNNLKVVNYFKSEFGHSQEDGVRWMNHWMHEGFAAFQALIRDDTPFCFGQEIGLADICLVGQMVNAKRWGLDMAPFGRLEEIDARCLEIEAVRRGMPEAQPDAQ